MYACIYNNLLSLNIALRQGRLAAGASYKMRKCGSEHV